MSKNHMKNGEELKRINLGCGTRRVDGFLNLDILDLPEVDIVCDLNKGIPLPDNSVEEIYTAHTLEHLDDIVHIMSEIHRVCIPGAIVRIKVPYFKSIGAFKDPTHKQFFTEQTFEYFVQQNIQDKKLPEYKLDINFNIRQISYIWSSPFMRYLPFKKLIFLPFFWNIARTIYYELEVQ